MTDQKMMTPELHPALVRVRDASRVLSALPLTYNPRTKDGWRYASLLQSVFAELRTTNPALGALLDPASDPDGCYSPEAMGEQKPDNAAFNERLASWFAERREATP